MGENAMIDRKMPNIIIEKISLERVRDYHEAIVESSQEWFAEGMIPKPDLSMDELEHVLKNFLELWENDNIYLFSILDASTNQVVGFVFLNHVDRLYQMANLGYQVRTSRMGEGIATAAARLAARYGFEKLGFQRIEIVVRKDHIPSLKVAEKLGAVREGLLRNRLQLHGSAYHAYMYSLIPNDFGIHKTV
jgi:ribosomal-protein-serine acetyltransferase